MTLVTVEDLYRPYKQKKRTRAMIAREKGLEPLANLIFLQASNDPKEDAKEYADPGKGVETPEEALQGAKDILAEMISDDAKYREWIRRSLKRMEEFCLARKSRERSLSMKCIMILKNR